MFRVILPIIVVISLSACSNSSKRRNTPYISSNSTLPFRYKPALLTSNDGKSQTTSAPLANQLTTSSGINASTITSTTPTQTASVPAKTAATNVAVNPSHGQPGHRCDISVGAPLNSAPVTAANTKSLSNQTVTPTPTPVPAKTAATNVAVNPSHGQPGHRCDISVGAPLNSAPVTASTGTNTSAATQATSTTTTPSVSPILPAVPQNQAAGDKNVRLNPAHGQPGHDCTIAVGQPLKK